MGEPLRELVPNLLWAKEHPVRLAGGRFLTRMTVMRLDDGLCLHSPVEIDGTTRSAIEALGEVRAIIAPSTFHHFFVASAQRAFPAARTYAVEGLERKRKDLRFDELLGDEPPALWAGQMDQVVIGNRVHAGGGLPASREPYAHRGRSRGELPRRDPGDQRHAARVDAPLRHVGTAARRLLSFGCSRGIGRPPVSPSNGCWRGTSTAPSSPTGSCSTASRRRPSARRGGGSWTGDAGTVAWSSRRRWSLVSPGCTSR